MSKSKKLILSAEGANRAREGSAIVQNMQSRQQKLTAAVFQWLCEYA